MSDRSIRPDQHPQQGCRSTASRMLASGFGRTQYTYNPTQIIPPVWPSLLDTSLFGDDSFRDDTGENRESHSYSVIVVTVNVCTTSKLGEGFAEDDDTVIELVSFHSEFAYEGSRLRNAALIQRDPTYATDRASPESCYIP